MSALALVVGLLAVVDVLPTFSQFKVAEKFTGKPAPPVLRSRKQRTFQTVIREAAKDGPNFAGHYTLVQWGCGAGCMSMAIVDNKSGQTFDGAFNLLGYDLSYAYEGGEDQLEFHPDSRLLVARGCPEEKNCGTYFYEWVGDQCKLVKRIPARKVEMKP